MSYCMCAKSAAYKQSDGQNFGAISYGTALISTPPSYMCPIFSRLIFR